MPRPRPICHDPDMIFLRPATLGLLRRYFRMSIALGRLPTLLGREVFRSRVSRRRTQSFEDSVIFVHDVERILGELDELSRNLLARVVFQEYSYEEAAQLLGLSRRTVARRYPEALDTLSAALVEHRLLRPAPGFAGSRSCQEGKHGELPASA